MQKSAKTPWKLIFKLGIFITFPLFGLSLLGISFFYYGYWQQAELTAIYLYATGALCFLNLLAGLKIYPKTIFSLFRYPLVWTSLLIALVSLILSPFHPVPLINFWGAPQMGEGILFYLSLASISAMATFLSRSPKLRKYLIYWAIFIGTLISILTFVGANESPFNSLRGFRWTPYFFPDYIAFIALAFFIYIVQLKKRESCKYSFLIFPILAFIFIFYASHNKTLWLGTIIALLAVMGLKIIIRKSSAFNNFLPYAIYLILLGFIVILGLAAALELKIPGTLLTRGYFILYTFYNFIIGGTLQDFSTFLIGRGWGEYQEFIAPNIFLVDSAKLFTDSQFLEVANQRGANEETLNREFFHSHNIIIEYFSALGMVGIILIFTKIYYLAKSLKKDYKLGGALYLISYWLLSSFWFELPATVPFSLLAMVLISGRYYPSFLKFNFKPFTKPLYILSPILLIIFAIPVGIMTQKIAAAPHIRKGEDYHQKIKEMTNNPWLSLDHLLGFKRTSHMLRFVSIKTLEFIDKGVFSIDEIYQGNRLIADYLFERRLECGNLYAMMIPINIYGELAVNKYTKELFDKDSEAQKNWESISLAFNKCVPKRSDMLIPLLNNLTLKAKTNRVKKVVGTLLVRNPEDPVGLWFSGILKLENSSTSQEGLEELKKAYRKGINRFIPISSTLKKQLHSSF